jgi:transcriptional regulator with PAS, ATPase and Fis domain
MLFPWFISYYTNYDVKWFKILAAVLFFTIYIGYITDFQGLPFAVWILASDFTSLIVKTYALIGIYHLINSGNKSKAFPFLIYVSISFIMSGEEIYFLLTGNGIAKYFDLNFYPVDFNHLLLIIMMSYNLIKTYGDHHNVINKVSFLEHRWENFIADSKFFIVTLDSENKIKSASKSYLNLFKNNSERLIGSHFESVNIEFNSTKISEVKGEEFFRTSLKTGDFERFILWSKFNTGFDPYTSDSGSIICIGTEISEKIKLEKSAGIAYAEIEDLKSKFRERNFSVKSAQNEVAINGGEIIGESSALKYVLMRVSQVAETDSTVLLEGETGVGKELIADLIHKSGLRKDIPFVKVNCSALPANLLESELFGHEKGAFTGADRYRIGRFELADKGTLFLDEIAELPLELQPKLLRVLQEGEFERLGSSKTIKVDVRIIAASNKKLITEVENGNFRSDLFYRLSVFPITIPALRQRKKDIPLLITKFVKMYSKKHNKSITEITPEVMEILCNYDWPGNIRELQNIIERSVIQSQGNLLRLNEVPVNQIVLELSNQNETGNEIKPLVEAEKIHILKALEKANWKISGSGGAAEILEIHPNTLRSKMQKLSIYKP